MQNMETEAIHMNRETEENRMTALRWETASIDRDGQKVTILFPVYEKRRASLNDPS